MPSAYPTEVRNTGAGLSIGIGRIGAFIAPLLAGFLLEAGWSSSRTYLVFAVPLLVAAAATVVLGRVRAAPAIVSDGA
jgi:MFS family permease